MYINFIESGISALTTTATNVAYLLVGPFLVLYILGEVRGWRLGKREANLGAKLIAALFLSLSFQVTIMGLAVLLSELLRANETGMDRSMITRNAWGLFLGGVVSGLIPAAIYGVIDRRNHPSGASMKWGKDSVILRQALGINVIIDHGIATLSLISLFVLLFNQDKEGIWPTLIVAAVYGIAAIACLQPLIKSREAVIPKEQSMTQEELLITL